MRGAVASTLLSATGDREETMQFELKPDFEASMTRYEAFWECGVADRPPVCITLPRPGARPEATGNRGPDDDPFIADGAAPLSDHASRWLDLERRVADEVRRLESTAFLGDALPVAWPNMGPEIFSAWCGAGYVFGETTAWSQPCIEEWERDAPAARLDTSHPLFEATVRFTDLLIEAGRGRFIVGLTDFHPGGDHLAALRDPEALAIDLIDHPDWVKRMLAAAEDDYWKAYEVFYDRVHAAGMPTTSWIHLPAWGRYYIPSNDFSALISPAMFEEFFLDGIARECRYLDRSIYHLDGPDALRHLHLLLAIPELDAIQFIPGAGNEGLERWLPVYRRIQSAGKGIMIWPRLDELDLVFEHLRPEGVYVSAVHGVRDSAQAAEVLERFRRWH